MSFHRFRSSCSIVVPRHVGLTLLAAAALTASALSWAAQTTVSNVPLATLSVAAAKPNIMFILDDSGSMSSDYMPDDMSDTTRYGFKSSQCNGVAYNPAITYALPVSVNATSGAVTTYASATFTAARTDGFNAGSSTTNLNNSVYYKYTGAQAPLNWTYDSSGNVVTSSTFYAECNTAIPGNGNGNTLFTKVTVTSTSTEAQNYANWYSYYRTRQLMTRSAAGRAFSDLSDAYRVGFTKISDSSVTGSNFINVADFSATQKNSFLTKLYGSSTGGNTPLRGALSKVGRYYGNVLSGQTDPVQYSCQRNFAVLSTDGYWNTGSETTSYRGIDLSGNQVGQQDGTEVRPMKDSTSVSYTQTTTTQNVGTSTVTTNLQLRRTMATQSGSLLAAASGCSLLTGAPFKLTTQTQVCSPDQTAVKTEVFATSSTTTQIDNVINGVVTTGAPTTGPVTTSNTPTSSTTVPATLTCSSNTWVNSGTASSSSCISLLNLNTLLTSLGLGSTAGASPPTVVAGSSATVNSPLTSQTTTGPVASATVTTNGPTNTLADIAEYYWKTDLRTSGSVATNNVPATDDDPATWQHMSTYTIGLGVKGTLTYDRDYLTQASGDYVDLTTGAKDWPSPSVSSNGGDARNIDDLWHAAVNGRGQYFSASDPNQLDDAIATTLASITRTSGSGGAAGASSLTPVAGDDWLFLPTFTSVVWTGDVRAYKFTFNATGDPIVPDTSAGKPFVWSASDKLSARTDARRILFNKTGVLDTFTYANLSTAGKAGVFDTRCTRGTTADNLSQCASITATAKAKVTGANLVSYLAGDGSLEIGGSVIDNRVFRNRTSLLGDLVGAAPVYVGKPPFRYADAGYASYASDNANRRRMVYVAANDGMLHAFNVGSNATDAAGGAERWAFVPSAAMTEMWRLADKAYGTNHRYYVDATPTVADVYDSATSSWKTILVGGLGAGGRSYYALDITDPESDPKLLWEISSTNSDFTNLGLTFGNPIVTKNKVGTWTVAFGSGLNNVGDGVGRLFVVNAMTGALISTVATSAGDTGTPSNLGRLNAWIDSDTDNTAQRFYAGDMLGNLWRFDHDDRIAPSGNEALLLGQAQAANGTAQPIVGKPVLSEISVGGVKTPIISFGTGRLLNANDLSDTTVQTIYSVKDAGAASGLGVLRSTAAKLVQQTFAANRTLTTLQPVDWATKNGWYIDLNAVSGAKERINVDGEQLAGGVLAFASTLPTSDACGQGGSSILYKFDLSNGNVLGADVYETMIVGLGRVASATSGKVSAIVTTSDSKIKLSGGPDPTILPPGTVKRSSWRELSE